MDGSLVGRDAECAALRSRLAVSRAGPASLAAYADGVHWISATSDDWVTAAALSLVGVGIILHVGIGLRLLPGEQFALLPGYLDFPLHGQQFPGRLVVEAVLPVTITGC